MLTCEDSEVRLTLGDGCQQVMNEFDEILRMAEQWPKYQPLGFC